MIKKTLSFLLFMAVMALYYSTHTNAFAQEETIRLESSGVTDYLNEKTDNSTLSHEIYSRLSPEDQAQVIEESNKVYEYCNKRELFASFHDCECVAGKFFDARLLNPDPTMSIITIGDRVAKECPNIPGVAGFAYEECHKSYGFKLKVGLEEFCQCYAKSYASFYQKDPRAVRPNMTSIGSRSLIECDATGIASPLNPDRF